MPLRRPNDRGVIADTMDRTDISPAAAESARPEVAAIAPVARDATPGDGPTPVVDRHSALPEMAEESAREESARELAQQVARGPGEPAISEIDESPGRPSRASIPGEIGRLLRGSGPSRLRRTLSIYLAGIVTLLMLNVVGQVRLNRWNGEFFNAISDRGFESFTHQIMVFLAIVAFLLVLVVAQTWLQEMMKVRLREFLTRRLLDGWMVPGRTYRLAMTSEYGVNPDQRIQDDTRQLTDFSVEIGIGVLQSSILLIAFVGVLWGLSSQVAFDFAGYNIVIPGYMVWCAVIYTTLGSFLTWIVGRPLIDLNAQRYAREADLRFALVRMSESAESVALYAGEANERRVLESQLTPVILAMRRLSGALSRLTWITSGFGWLAMVVPVLVASPGYFNGSLSLGGLMMVVGAFSQVQMSLRYFVDNFPRFADWRASLWRVASFAEAVDAADEVDPAIERLTVADHPEGALAFHDLSILLSDGSVVIGEANAEIHPGERVLITGPSGSGKSTLLRAIAGLWTWGSGTILVPPRNSMMFMPQRPYLPLDTLKGAVTYPAAPEDYSAETVAEALERVGLAEIVPQLDMTERWDKALSLGQQQRLAFARLLLHRPQWVFLDEATAALDEENQMNVMSIFDREMQEASIVSIGHRPGLDVFHTRTLELVSSPGGARLRRKRAPARPQVPGGGLDEILGLVLRRLLRA